MIRISNKEEGQEGMKDLISDTEPLSFNSLEAGNLITSFVHDPPFILSDEEIFIQDFLVILKRVLQTCFFSTTCIVVCLGSSSTTICVTRRERV